MNGKLFVFDVGNTLLVKPATVINKETIVALRNLHDAENIVGVASMRNKLQFQCLRTEFPFDFYIGLNGSYVELNDQIVIENPLSEQDVFNIVEFANQHNVRCLLHTKECVVPFLTEVKESVFVVELFDVCRYSEALKAILNNKYNYHLWEGGKTCDIYAKTASKRIALQEICRLLSVQRCDCIAFGDGYNDTELFKFCGKSVAMATAPDELKTLSTYVTKPASQNGVVWALTHFEL